MTEPRYRAEYNDRVDGWVVVTLAGVPIGGRRYGTERAAKIAADRLTQRGTVGPMRETPSPATADSAQAVDMRTDLTAALEAKLARLRVLVPQLVTMGFPCRTSRREPGICIQHSRPLPCIVGELRQLLEPEGK